jgi:hypothetical protein
MATDSSRILTDFGYWIPAKAGTTGRMRLPWDFSGQSRFDGRLGKNEAWESGNEEMREAVSREGRSGEERDSGLFRGLGRPAD